MMRKEQQETTGQKLARLSNGKISGWSEAARKRREYRDSLQREAHSWQAFRVIMFVVVVLAACAFAMAYLSGCQPVIRSPKDRAPDTLIAAPADTSLLK